MNGEKALPILTAQIPCCVCAFNLSVQELKSWGGCEEVQGSAAPLNDEKSIPNTDILLIVAGFPSRACAVCETPALLDLTQNRGRWLRTGDLLTIS
jgi:hypothetical protein